MAAHPHVHGNQVDAHRCHIAIDLRIVSRQQMLCAFKPGKTLLVAGGDVGRTNDGRPAWPHHCGVVGEYPSEMLDIELLVIEGAKIAVDHVDYLELVNQCA